MNIFKLRMISIRRKLPKKKKKSPFQLKFENLVKKIFFLSNVFSFKLHKNVTHRYFKC